jgi:hypothetical protein
MMLNNHVFLDPVLTEQAQKVYENGIGYVNGSPHVADWFVPYEVPIKLIGQDWNEKKIELPVFPMRGSNTGIHTRFNGLYSRKYEGDYYLADRLGAKVARIMHRKNKRIISFRLNKPHDTFHQHDSEQREKCWSSNFANGFCWQAIDLGWREVESSGLRSAGGMATRKGNEIAGCSDYAIAYVGGLSKEKASAVLDLLRQWGDISEIEERVA